VSARPPWARAGIVAALVLAADQVSKALIVASIALGERRHVIGGVLSLVHAQNSGVAFSLLSGSEVIVVLVTLVIVGGVLAFFARHADTRLLWLATGLIVGGALGNLLDRIRTGSVTDFIQLPHWPAFNLADTSITLGVATLIVILGRGGSAARPA
jgi:signal peptidase II